MPCSEPLGEGAVWAVVPTWCEAPRVEALIAGLRREGLGCLVVDAGSPDGTAARAAAAGARVLADQPPCRGAQLHAGARALRGAAGLLFLHADGGVPVGLGAALRAGLAAGPWGCFRVEARGAGAWLAVTAATMNLRAAETSVCTGDMGQWFRGDAYDRLGGYPAWTVLEDLALAERARRRWPAQLLRPALRLDPRRWAAQGRLRTSLRMWALRAAFRLGAEGPQVAAAWPRGWGGD